MIKRIKAHSSKLMNSQKVYDFSWQKGYGVFSVSESQLDSLFNYIETQLIHHKKIGFEEEYKLFLNKHNIVFDHDYLWS